MDHELSRLCDEPPPTQVSRRNATLPLVVGNWARVAMAVYTYFVVAICSLIDVGLFLLGRFENGFTLACLIGCLIWSIGLLTKPGTIISCEEFLLEQEVKAEKEPHKAVHLLSRLAINFDKLGRHLTAGYYRRLTLVATHIPETNIGELLPLTDRCMASLLHPLLFSEAAEFGWLSIAVDCLIFEADCLNNEVTRLVIRYEDINRTQLHARSFSNDLLEIEFVCNGEPAWLYVRPRSKMQISDWGRTERLLVWRSRIEAAMDLRRVAIEPVLNTEHVEEQSS